MKYKIVFESGLAKQIRKLGKKQRAFLRQKLMILEDNPFPRGKNPKKLKGSNNFRLRVGNLRVLYQVIDFEVRIFVINLRKDVYKKL